MTNCSSPDELFCDSLSRDCTHHADIDSLIFDRLSDRKTIDNCPHHSHIVSRHTIESSSLEFDTTIYIASPDYDHDLEFLELHEVHYFFGKKGEKFWIYSISLFSLECLT